MKLQNRLLSAFSINIFLLILVGLTNTVFIVKSRNTLENISSTIIAGEKHIDNIKQGVSLVHSDILSQILLFKEDKTYISTDEDALFIYNELSNLEKIFHEDKDSFKFVKYKFQEFYLYGKWIYNLTGIEDLKKYPDAINKFKIQKKVLVQQIDYISEKYERIYKANIYRMNRNGTISLLISIIVIIAGFFLSITISYRLSRTIARPVLELTQTLSEVEKGNFEVHSTISSHDEIGHMAMAVNKMSNELNKNFKTLSFLQSLLNSILDSVDTVVIAVDKNLNITYWNSNAVNMTGIGPEVAGGCSFNKYISKEIISSDSITLVLKDRMKKDILKKQVLHNDKLSYYNISIYPHKNKDLDGAVLMISDVTEVIQLENLMIQSEKMLSVGGLAAGMAHEINNPLAGMIQTANVMSKRLIDPQGLKSNVEAAEEAGLSLEAMNNYMKKRDIPKMLESINMSGRQISDIVDNMLSFSRKDENRKSSRNIEDLIDKTLKLAQTDYNMKKSYDFRQISIKKDFQGNLPMIICESVKLQQVILNILRNGAQAMQEQNSHDHQFIIRTKFLINKNMVSLEIEDNGPGMDEKIRKRIFEPFFTTKPEGIGTGLGLSVSYFIITDTHKGEMSVTSRKGAGTIFTINLPLS